MKFAKIIAAGAVGIFLLFGGITDIALGDHDWEAGSPEAELRSQFIAGLQQPGVAGYCTPEEERLIWDFLLDKIGNPYGAAGLMGNLYSESALRSTNLQQKYEKLLGHTDESYTLAVDLGLYKNFVSDRAGYGLAQWTTAGRKTNLLAFANDRGSSIADLDMQLEFLYHELEQSFPGVLAKLKNATSVREASDCVLTQFEMPKDQGPEVQIARAKAGDAFFYRYAFSPRETEGGE